MRIAALVAALAYVGLLLLEFLRPYRTDPSLDRWSAAVLLAGVLAVLFGLFPLLGERRGPIAFVFLGLAVVGVALLFWGAAVDALYGPAYPPAGQVLVMGLFLAAAGLMPLGAWLLFAGGLPGWAAISLLVGAPPLAIFLFPPVGPAWAIVGYALFREGSAGRR